MTRILNLAFFIFLAQLSFASNSNAIHVVLNQPMYAPGDTAFFKVYVMGPNKSLVQERLIMNLSVFNEIGKELIFQKFRVDQGIGINQWVIPETFKPGSYTISFYPDWTGDLTKPPLQFLQTVQLVDDKLIINAGNANGTILDEKKILPDPTINVAFNGLQNEVSVNEKSRIELSIQDKNGIPLEADFSLLIQNSQLYDGTTNSEGVLKSNKDTDFTFKGNLGRKGKVRLQSGKSVPDSTQIMFYLQKTKWKNQMVLDSSGIVNVWIPDFFDEDELYYLAKTKRGKDINHLSIEWIEENKLELRKNTLTEANRKSIYGDFVLKRNLTHKSYGYYEGVQDSSIFYSKGELGSSSKSIIYIKDYRSFPTMEEFIKEVVPSIKVRRKKGNNIVRVKLDDPSPNDPIYEIDGIITKNTAFFLSLIPSELKSIDVLRKPYFIRRYGLLGQDGVVIIKTKSGNIKVPRSDNSIIIQGLNKKIDFGNLEENRASEKPNIRSSIYWNPSLKTNENGNATVEINWSDDTGTMTLIVDGITKDGNYFNVSKKMNVVPQ